MLGGIGEVGVASLALTFAEGKRNGDYTACFEALAPEAVTLNLYGGKGNRGDGVTTRGVVVLVTGMLR